MGVEMAGGDDFNSLYERLVVRRTPKTRGKRVATPVKTKHAEEKKQEQVGNLPKASVQEEVDAEAERKREQQERDARTTSVVKRLRLARNLRGFARLSECNPHRLAFQICASNEQEQRRFVESLKGFRGQRPIRRQLFSEKCRLQITRRTRLEKIAARLYLKREGDFRNGTATSAVEGRHRLMDEFLFFSPPNTELRSQIGYAQVANVVPLPPK